LLGMSNGVREVWVHSPADMGASWQTRRYGTKEHFEVAAALNFYASGKGSLRSKLSGLVVRDMGKRVEKSVGVARLSYSGNDDPEPGAWGRFVKLMKNEGVEVSVVKAGCGELDVKKEKVVHMTGTGRFTLKEEDVKALRKFLDAGGMLFADAAGGSKEFDESMMVLMKGMYPEEKVVEFAGNHPIFTGTMKGGKAIGEVEFRRYGSLMLGKRVTVPAMSGIVVGGKTKVVYSKWDVSSGFLGTHTWGIVGYGPGTAEEIGRNVLAYAMDPVAVPAVVREVKETAEK
jgi:hypothetical protein